MSMKGLSQYEQHFLLSNPIVKFILGVQSNDSSYRLLFLWCTFAAYLFPILVIQIFMTDTNLQSRLSSLQKILSGACVYITYSTCYIRYDIIKELFARAKQDYQQLSSKEEFGILDKYTKEMKLYTIIFVCFFTIYALGLSIPSLFNVLMHNFGLLDDVQLTLPFPVKNIFNPGLLFYALLIYQITAICIILTISSVIYPLFLMTIQHACLQFSIIMFKIRRSYNDEKFKNNLHNRSHQLEWEWIVDIINRYARVTEFVNLINSVTKITFLLGAILVMVLLFFDLLWIMQLSSLMQDLRETIVCFVIIVGTFLTVFITFYTGQTLINHSITTYDELCQIPFYIFPVKIQKLVLFLIVRTVKPCELSIGGIYVASHETLALIVQKTFSFATVYYSTL